MVQNLYFIVFNEMLHLEKCREFGFQLRCPSIISLVTGLRLITSYEESETLFLAFLLMLVLYCTRNPEVLFLTTGVPGKRAKINPAYWSDTIIFSIIRQTEKFLINVIG